MARACSRQEAHFRSNSRQNPELTTVRTAALFGQADRNLVLFGAANTGSTVLAILIGAVIVMNTMLLSFVDRTREFGILRAVGWTRRKGHGPDAG